MNFTRRKKQPKARIALMNAAIKLVRLHGYKKLTVTAISHEADYSRRTFYKYFRNPDDMLSQILLEWSQSSHYELMQHLEKDPTPSPLREYRHWYRTVILLHKNVEILQQLPDLLRHDIGKPTREALRTVMLENLANEGINSREGISPELLVSMEMNMASQIIETLKETGNFADAKAIIDDHFRLIFNQDPPDVDIDSLL